MMTSPSKIKKRFGHLLGIVVKELHTKFEGNWTIQSKDIEVTTFQYQNTAKLWRHRPTKVTVDKSTCCETMDHHFGIYITGYLGLLVTQGFPFVKYWLLTGYLLVTSAYFSLLLVTSRYFSLLLVTSGYFWFLVLVTTE